MDRDSTPPGSNLGVCSLNLRDRGKAGKLGQSCCSHSFIHSFTYSFIHSFIQWLRIQHLVMCRALCWARGRQTIIREPH